MLRSLATEDNSTHRAFQLSPGGDSIIQICPSKVKLAAVRENDDGVDLQIDDRVKSAEGKTASKRLKGEKITPFRAQWVANLIKPVIKDSPNKHLFLV
jgi:hypothetical protein